MCFTGIASFYGGQYPYHDLDETNLAGFYIDTMASANIYCYKLDDIKKDCGQDWSFLKQTADNFINMDESTETDAENSAIEHGETGQSDELLQDLEDDKELNTNSDDSKPFILFRVVEQLRRFLNYY